MKFLLWKLELSNLTPKLLSRNFFVMVLGTCQEQNLQLTENFIIKVCQESGRKGGEVS